MLQLLCSLSLTLFLKKGTKKLKKKISTAWILFKKLAMYESVLEWEWERERESNKIKWGNGDLLWFLEDE